MDPFLGQISIVSFNFAPKGWALCNGQLLPIQQNQALFSILGTTYGGDGRVTFALPNLQGRAAMNAGPSNQVGAMAGSEAVTVTTQQIAPHTHPVNAVSSAGVSAAPANRLWAGSTGSDLQYALTRDTFMAPGASASAGGNQPHNNIQPSLVLNFVIAMVGIFPPRS